jgi:hypothetical protein
MSLVSEALRKARAEAAERGARHRGVVFRTTVVLGPKGTRLSVPWLAILVVAAAVAGAGIAWWALSPRGSVASAPLPTDHAVLAPGSPTSTPKGATADGTPTATPTSAPEPPQPTPAAGAAAPPTRTPGPQPDSAAARVRPTGGQGQSPEQRARPTPMLTRLMPPIADVSAAPPVVTPEPAEPRAEANGARPGTRPAATRGAEAAAGTAPEGERSFGLDADLGYAKLHLDYIVYRSKAPFAGINGQQVIVGSVVAGFTVEAIAAESVLLRDAQGTVELRVH